MFSSIVRRLLPFGSMLLVLAVMAVHAAEPPPLLDRELFFGDPEISGAQISPDGEFIAFIKPLDGTRNVWVKRTDQPFDQVVEEALK